MKPWHESLAPLQRVMLATKACGAHVEQVEITFSKSVSPTQIHDAWRDTVDHTEALQITFPSEHRWDWAERVPALEMHDAIPQDWATWLLNDRHHDLMHPKTSPWRAVLWPEARRFVWTFHHALLDGRSITRILRSFLDRIDGMFVSPLALAKWSQPSPDCLMRGEKWLLAEFSGVTITDQTFVPSREDTSPAKRMLGNDFLKPLSRHSNTVATQLTWAWGQALLNQTRAKSVIVEQLRVGAPQPGTAGFTMNTCPLLMRRASDETLLDFSKRLLDLREIEAVCSADFPPGVYPDTNHPACSMIMVEHGTLQHQLGHADLVESIALHEPRGESRIATAYLLPNLRLEVEGPGRHELLDAWVSVLEILASEKVWPGVMGEERALTLQA
jgi:hypothetical protein